MNYDNLHLFLTTVEEMNISRAAQRLYMSPQALSAQIRRLEQKYGVVLFERSPRLKITPAGEIFAHYAKSIIMEEKRLQSQLLDYSNLHHKITLGVTSAASLTLLPLIWPRYHKICPNASFVHVGGLSDQLIEALQQRTVDVCICANRFVSGLENVVMDKEQFYFVIHRKILQTQMGDAWKDYVKMYQDGITLKEIANYPLLMFPKENRLTKAIENYYYSCNYSYNVVFETPMVDLQLFFVQQAYGGCLLPREYIYTFIHKQDNDLLIFRVGDTLSTNTLGLVYLSGGIDEYTRTFIEVTKEVFDELRAQIYDKNNIFIQHNSAVIQKLNPPEASE